MPDQIIRLYPNSHYPDRLKRIARKYTINLLDLTDAFKTESDGVSSLFIDWDNHPNPKAYRLTAAEIVKAYFGRERRQGWDKTAIESLRNAPST
jgi:hypothetical protein